MGVEIERKFLVNGEAWKRPDAIRYCQGYLNSDTHRTVRVRIAGDSAFLTIKGPSSGATRAEFEYPIPVSDAKQMLKLCDGPVVEKFRHIVNHGGMVWEVDEFLGDNQGLVVAEVELTAEDQQFDLPDWVADEVTDDVRYFNSNLSTNPFKTWTTS